MPAGVPDRREVVAAGLGLATLIAAPVLAAGDGIVGEGSAMYGLIGRMIAQPGRRDALIAILLEGTASMPGCLSYVVAKDASDENAIWVTEVWDSKESHAGSLKLPAVQAAIARGKPLITGFDNYNETVPMGGVGLN